VIDKKVVNKPKKIRESIVEGIFYPADRAELIKDIETSASQFANARGKAFAILSPHAALEYSGKYAAHAFLSAADRKIKTVVIIAPVHREPENALILTESDYFSTPIGQLRVAGNLVSMLEGCSTRFIKNDIPHLEEHSIEIQLPFVQYFFPKADILPILIGKPSQANITILARALETVFADSYDSTLIVISSNLCAYSNESEASSSIELLFDLIEKKDALELLNRLKQKEIKACGTGGIASLFLMDLPELKSKLLSSSTGEKHINDEGRIVHYGAFAFYR
jgi:MEMO1 family protein